MYIRRAHLILALTIAVPLGVLCMVGEVQSSNGSEDEAAVRDLVGLYASSSQGCGEKDKDTAFQDFFSTEADARSSDGKFVMLRSTTPLHKKTPQEIEGCATRAAEGIGHAGTTIDKVRFITRDVAIVDATDTFAFGITGVADFHNILVLQKVGKVWKIAAIRQMGQER